ncbi:MAG: TonB-dependent receptor [Acidobacteria bacterium]|nr:TonB-dependent receptor [Acidobacteriota bacterium]
MWLIAAVILAPALANAQERGVIEGVVRDATGAEVQGARVDVTGAASGTAVTDAVGRFRVENLPPGRYTVRAELSGFAPVVMPLELVSGAATADLRLDSVIAAESITVSGVGPQPQLDTSTEAGSRLGLTNREIPAIINIITFAETQARGLKTVIDALDRMPGVASTHTGGSPLTMAIRGFTGGAVSVLYDGTRLTTSTMVGRNQDSWSFDRIEVLKGPSSVLYGEGALAGSVNFISKRADFTRRRGGLLVSYGSLNSGRLAAEATGPLGSRAAYRADFVGSTTDGNNSNQFRTLAMSGGVDVRLKPTLTVAVSAEHFRDDYDTEYWGTPLIARSLAREPTDVVSDSRDLVLDRALRKTNFNVTDGVMDSETTWVRGKLEWQLSPGWRLNTEGYTYDTTRRWRNLEGYGFVAPASISRSTVLIDFDHQFYGNRTTLASDTRFGNRRNRFMAGAEANRNTFFNPRRFGTTTAVDPFNPVRGLFPEDTAANFPGAGNRTNFDTELSLGAVFMEDAISVAPRITAVAGVRHDWLTVDRVITDLNAGTRTAFTRKFGPTSWRTGVVFDAAAQTQLFGQYTYAVAPVATVLVISQTNLNFKLTTGDSWEGGVKSTLAGGRVETTASIFTITQDDILTRDPINFNLTVQGGTQKSTGVELTAAANLTPRWRLDANATFMDARFVNLLEAGGVSRAGNVPPNAPERLVGFWTAYDLSALPLTVAGGLRYQGRIFANTANTTRVSDFTVLDAQATWRTRSGDITLRARNLTDTLYASWTGGSANQVQLGAPRTIDLTYHVRF